ncbi:MAG: hypothetical protein ACYCUG_06060 [Acidimicrobiales bacterium]
MIRLARWRVRAWRIAANCAARRLGAKKAATFAEQRLVHAYNRLVDQELAG